MRSKLFILVVIFLLSGCVFDIKPYIIPDSITLKVNELKYGLCKTKTIRRAKTSPSVTGTKTITDHFQLIKKTDRIPGIPGIQFGVQFIIKADKSGYVPIESVWVFPKKIVNGTIPSHRSDLIAASKSNAIRLYSFSAARLILKTLGNHPQPH